MVRGEPGAPRPPGHGAVSIVVDDVDGRHSELVKRGAKIKEPKDDDGPRDFDVADLDGNVIFFRMKPKKR